VILTDTSVVIVYARGKDAKLNALMPTLPLAICGVVRAELLCGVRDAAHRGHLLSLLSPFQHIPIAEAIWDAVDDNLARLRLNGLTVPFPDLIIATLAIESGIEVWARDAHFRAMQRIFSSLMLYHEPP